MYLKEFEVRWNDLDANRHLANSSYINFMSHTRLSYMMENGFGQNSMVTNNIGPVVFYEHMFYFREVFPGKPIRVSRQLK
jgi:acyl-CoA thioester hydrolase